MKNIICPVCKFPISNVRIGDEDEKILSCDKITNYVHYQIVSADNETLRECFYIRPFKIYKLYPSNQLYPWEIVHLGTPHFRFNFSDEEFHNKFPEFDPSNLNKIKEKLEIYQTFM